MTTTPTKHDNGAAIGPQTMAYYDCLYRVLATDTEGFGGGWIRQESRTTTGAGC